MSIFVGIRDLEQGNSSIEIGFGLRRVLSLAWLDPRSECSRVCFGDPRSQAAVGGNSRYNAGVCQGCCLPQQRSTARNPGCSILFSVGRADEFNTKLQPPQPMSFGINHNTLQLLAQPISCVHMAGEVIKKYRRLSNGSQSCF